MLLGLWSLSHHRHGPGTWLWSPFVPPYPHGHACVHVHIPYPSMPGLCSVTSRAPTLAIGLWCTGLLLSTTCILQMGTHVLARMLAVALESGEPGGNSPLMQSLAHSLSTMDTGLALHRPPSAGTAASLVGTGEASN